MIFNQDVRGIALTLVAGAAGSALFHALNLPAPWLTGSLITITILALAGAPLFLPQWLRHLVFLLLGISIGSAFTPETLAGMLKWPLSLMGLGIAVLLVIAACFAYLTQKPKWDRETAFYAAVPGALSYVLAMAMRSTADIRLVTLAQMLRLSILLAILPTLITVSMPVPELPAPVFSSYWAMGGQFVLALLIGYMLERIEFPAAMLMGGMLSGAIFHLSGGAAGQIPLAVLIPAQIVLGCFIGLRFLGTDLDLLKRAIRPCMISFVIAVAVSSAVAFAVALGLHLPAAQLIVAFAPGGIEAMTILAFVLGLDPAFVGAHQLARFLGLSLLLPLVARLYLRRAPKGSG